MIANRFIAVFISTALLIACGDDVVSERVVKTYKKEIKENCDLGPGWCMECGISIDGSFDCYSKHKMNCSGERVAIATFAVVERVHESGDISKIDRILNSKPLSSCK